MGMFLTDLSCPGAPGIGFDFEYSVRCWANGFQVRRSSISNMDPADTWKRLSTSFPPPKRLCVGNSSRETSNSKANSSSALSLVHVLSNRALGVHSFDEDRTKEALCERPLPWDLRAAWGGGGNRT